VALPAAVALVAGCGAATPIPETDLLFSVTPGATEVELGKAFPLTVVRVWKKDLVPEAWTEKALAPLAVKLEEETRRDDGARVEETRRYLAHAFSLKDIVVRGLKLVAKPGDGGPERKVSATGFRIRVRPALDPGNPGPPELPGEPPPSRDWVWGGAGALAIAFALFLALRRKRPQPAPAPPAVAPPPPPAPHERALRRLEECKTVEEAADIVREYVAEAMGVRALEMTSEQLLVAIPALAAILGPADLAKFAAQPPTAAGRAAVLAAAEAFVRDAAGHRPAPEAAR
jgi:hypothetical protein